MGKGRGRWGTPRGKGRWWGTPRGEGGVGEGRGPSGASLLSAIHPLPAIHLEYHSRDCFYISVHNIQLLSMYFSGIEIFSKYNGENYNNNKNIFSHEASAVARFSKFFLLFLCMINALKQDCIWFGFGRDILFLNQDYNFRLPF